MCTCKILGGTCRIRGGVNVEFLKATVWVDAKSLCVNVVSMFVNEVCVCLSANFWCANVKFSNSTIECLIVHVAFAICTIECLMAKAKILMVNATILAVHAGVLMVHVEFVMLNVASWLRTVEIF